MTSYWESMSAELGRMQREAAASRYPDAVEALQRAADVLEQRPYLNPVEYLRDCARELEDDE